VLEDICPWACKVLLSLAVAIRILDITIACIMATLDLKALVPLASLPTTSTGLDKALVDLVDMGHKATTPTSFLGPQLGVTLLLHSLLHSLLAWVMAYSDPSSLHQLLHNINLTVLVNRPMVHHHHSMELSLHNMVFSSLNMVVALDMVARVNISQALELHFSPSTSVHLGNTLACSNLLISRQPMDLVRVQRFNSRSNRLLKFHSSHRQPNDFLIV